MRFSMVSHRRRTALPAVIALAAATACGGGAAGTKPNAAASSVKPTVSTASYAAELGGLDKLAAAATREGKLNVIGLRSDWANYGELLERFQAKYGITVSSRQPDASSREELSAAAELRGTAQAPDVFDLSRSAAAENVSRLAPYKVAFWGDIPDPAKDPSGRYVGSYGGVMSIGYDAHRVPRPAAVLDLLKAAYRGRVALNGSPTRTTSALHAVALASLGNGGSAADVGPGVDFFARLRQDGNLSLQSPTEDSIVAGRTPVVLDWDYTNVQRAATLPKSVDWRVVIPSGVGVGSYYVSAINVDAPHPAAARLWQEFVFSDEGQNLLLRSAVRPVRADAMARTGGLDQGAFARVPPAPARVTVLAPQQITAARAYLVEHWSKAVN